jgi:hypothetical protein
VPPALLLALATALLPVPALSDNAAPAPVPPPPATPPAASPVPPPATPPATPAIPSIPLLRVVPKGEARAIAFYASLNPDCSVIGPVVVRTLTPPARGRLTVEAADGFTRFGPGSPLAACNSRKVAGTRLVYEAQEGFEGVDTFRILVINADGSGYESDVRVSVR